MVLRTGKEVGIGSGDGGDEVMHGDGLAVEGSLLISVGGQLHWLNGARVFGQNHPQVAIVFGHRKRQKRFQGAGIEIGQEHRAGMRSQPRGGALSACRNIQQELSCIGSRHYVHRLAVHDRAQLHVLELVGRGKLLGLRDRVVQALHGHLDQGGRVVTLPGGREMKTGSAHRVAVLRDLKIAGLRPRRRTPAGVNGRLRPHSRRQRRQHQGKKSRTWGKTK